MVVNGRFLRSNILPQSAREADDSAAKLARYGIMTITRPANYPTRIAPTRFDRLCLTRQACKYA